MCFLLVLVMFGVRESLTLHLTLSREPLSNYRFVGPISRFLNSHKRPQNPPTPMMPYMDFDMSGFMQPSLSELLQMAALDSTVDSSPTVVTGKPLNLNDFSGHKSVATNSRWASGHHSYSEASTDYRESNQPNSFHMSTTLPVYPEPPEAPNYHAETPQPSPPQTYHFAQHDEGRKQPTKIVVFQPQPKSRWPQKPPGVWQEESVGQRTKIPQHSHGGWYGSVSDASLEVPYQKEWRSRPRRKKSLKKWKNLPRIKDHYRQNEEFKIVYVESNSGRQKHSSTTAEIPEDHPQERQPEGAVVYGKPLKENGALPKRVWKGQWD